MWEPMQWFPCPTRVNLKKQKKNLLAQSLKQYFVSVALPGHGSPSPTCPSHVLFLLCTPSQHSTLHSSQLDHDDHSPFTKVRLQNDNQRSSQSSIVLRRKICKSIETHFCPQINIMQFFETPKKFSLWGEHLPLVSNTDIKSWTLYSTVFILDIT